MLARMSGAELDDWSRYWAQEPFGAWRDNLHAAQIAAILFNAYRDPKKGQKLTVLDFMYEGPGVKESRRRREVIEMFKGLAALKGTGKKGSKPK